MTGLLNSELQQSLTSYTDEFYTANPPKVEEMRSKCHDYMSPRKIIRSHRAPRKVTASVTYQSVPNAKVNPSAATPNQSKTLFNQPSKNYE